MLLQLVQDVLDRRGRLGLRHGTADDADRLGLAAPGVLLGDVAVADHQGQDLVAALQRSRAARHGCVVARRLADSCKQRGTPGVLARVAGQWPAEVVLGGRAEAITAAAHVDEARIASEDLALRLLPRPILLAHLFLEPECQAHFLQLAKQLVGGGSAQDGRHGPRQRQAVHEHGIVVPAGGQVPQKIDAHELLRDGRPALGHPQAKSGAVLPLRQRTRQRFLDHPRQRAIVDPGMRVEVLVLGRQDGLTHHERHFVVRHHPPVLPCELDYDLSPGVQDLARRGGLEQEERSEVGKVATVEVDVVEQGGRRQRYQGRDDRAGDAHGPLRPGGTQAAGRSALALRTPRAAAAPVRGAIRREHRSEGGERPHEAFLRPEAPAQSRSARWGLRWGPMA